MNILGENNEFLDTCGRPKLKQQNINNFNIHVTIKIEAEIKILPTMKCLGLDVSLLLARYLEKS